MIDGFVTEADVLEPPVRWQFVCVDLAAFFHIFLNERDNLAILGVANSSDRADSTWASAFIEGAGITLPKDDNDAPVLMEEIFRRAPSDFG